jgi:hypothetical protein
MGAGSWRGWGSGGARVGLAGTSWIPGLVAQW